MKFQMATSRQNQAWWFCNWQDAEEIQKYEGVEEDSDGMDFLVDW